MRRSYIIDLVRRGGALLPAPRSSAGGAAILRMTAASIGNWEREGGAWVKTAVPEKKKSETCMYNIIP